MDYERSEKFVPMIWGGPNEGMETAAQTLCRVRKRIAAAGTRGGKTWEEIFALSDRNRDGVLNLSEYMSLIREKLRIPPQAICDNDAKLLFYEMDKNNNDTIDAAELIEHIQHGPRRQQDDAARFDVRIERVRRNMRLAFQSVGGTEMDARRIFQHMDLDDSTRITQYEFTSFVRNDLGLTRWDVQNSSLTDFYTHMDRNGDGLDVNELLHFLRQQHRDRGTLGPQSLYVPPKTPKVDRKRKTYKQKLSDHLQKSNSLPSLHTSSFTNLGRTCSPISRIAG
mmetsp:Transcript_140216/g.349498  ORF Transcript_140216/g.349498 Transcript_140216/m.349498 type:complete len:281 (+) Transcript_140216:67-909(+)